MLIDQINSDMLTALKKGDKVRLSTLRFLLAEIKRFQIDHYPPASGKTLSDEDTLKIIRKQIKSHQDSIEAFRKGGRQDLVDQETAELGILKSYLPTELSDEELTKLVKDIIGKSGLTNFGRAMGMVMKHVAGRASADRVVQIVKKVLGML